jgi:hypothetical protein
MIWDFNALMMTQNLAPSETLQVNREDLPALYRTATEGSGSAQRNFLIAIFLNILFLTLGAVASGTNLSSLNNPRIEASIASLSFSFLLLSIFTTVGIEILKLEKKWYEGRAIAESVKTISWKFMMNSKPYKDKPLAEAENLFISNLMAVVKERKSFAELLGGKTASEPQITEKMRQIKLLNVSARKKIYLKNRIGGQKKWYCENSDKNRSTGFKFFIATVAFEFVAVISSAFIIQNPNLIFNPTGIITTMLAGILAWIQVKQYRTLAESYGLTAQELGLIEEKGRSASSNDSFSDFVLGAETAISREHTTWLARRVNS